MRHMLKNDPAMGDLKHVEVDGPGRAYLFFYDWHGYRGPPQRRSSGYAFPHCRCICRVDREIHTFYVVPLLLEAGRQCTGAMQERRRQRVRPLEEPVLPVPVNESTSSGSLQLVGGIPTVPETQEGATEQETPRLNVARPCR